MTFKDFIKGNFSATFRYSTNTNYDLAPSSQNVVESGTSDISVTANYNRQGFEIPFFGLSLSNDLDAFNAKLIDWLLFYNLERVHHAFGNKLSPVQFLVQYEALRADCKSR